MQAAAIPLADWLVIAPVLLPLFGAALLLMLPSRVVPGVAIGVIVLVAIGEGAVLHRVLTSGPVAMTMGRWLPPFGISFAADATGALLALVAAIISCAGAVQTALGREANPAQRSFFALVLLLLAGADGAFLTGDLFNLYVWFELTLIATFGLLVISGTPLALDGAIKYGVANFVATSMLLAALGLLYGATGTLNIADLTTASKHADPAVLASVSALFLLAFGTKAAVFPLNAWLPASYHTPPAVVSALLGGLVTKIGVYAIVRTLLFALPTTLVMLQPILAAIAAATLVLAPLAALAETNLRRTLGFWLVGGVGAAVAGIAMASPTALNGTVTYLVASMLTLCALYLISGVMERRSGTSDIRRMGGLYTTASGLSVLFLLLILSLSGVPPFLGFWPKLLLLQAALASASPGQGAATLGGILATCLLLNALLTLIGGARLWALAFWRPARPDPAAEPADIAEQSASTGHHSLAAGALTALIVATALWPEPLLAAGRAAAAGLLAAGPYVAAVGLGASP